MMGLLGIPLGEEGSGRVRYGQAMALHAAGRISAAQLEAYRVAAAEDRAPPDPVFADRHLPLPCDPPVRPEELLSAAIESIDHYLYGLSGTGLAETRTSLAAARDDGVRLPEPKGRAVVSRHLAPALEALAGTHPALAARLAAVAPLLAWLPPDPAEAADAVAAEGMAQARLIEGPDFALDLWLMAPHVLCPDHHHAAASLCVPLTGPQIWRFGPDRPLQIRRAHWPVWTPPHGPHLTKAGSLPLLCLCARIGAVSEPAQPLPSADWPALQDLRL